MDPHYSVLVGDTNEGMCQKQNNKNNGKLLGVYIAVPVGAVIIILLLASVFIIPRYYIFYISYVVFLFLFIYICIYS